mmetsp:Transcript_18101/g.27236  ORF Transcript_18101/g.27236 Transcript_18101/m.27236 type:complete len:152 (-) Transcript_18101:441-896(-)
MAEGAGGGAATFSFDDLTEAASHAAQLIRARLSPSGTKNTWLGPSSVLSDAIAGSVLMCESSEDGSFVAIIPSLVEPKVSFEKHVCAWWVRHRRKSPAVNRREAAAAPERDCAHRASTVHTADHVRNGERGRPAFRQAWSTSCNQPNSTAT